MLACVLPLRAMQARADWGTPASVRLNGSVKHACLFELFFPACDIQLPDPPLTVCAVCFLAVVTDFRLVQLCESPNVPKPGHSRNLFLVAAASLSCLALRLLGAGTLRPLNLSDSLLVPFAQRAACLAARWSVRSFAGSLRSLPLSCTANVYGDTPLLSDVFADFSEQPPRHMPQSALPPWRWAHALDRDVDGRKKGAPKNNRSAFKAATSNVVFDFNQIAAAKMPR